MAQGTKKRGRTLMYLALLLILVFLLVAFLLRNQILGATTAQQTGTAVPTVPPVENVSIMVAAQRIPRGSVISEQSLTSIPYPKKEVDAAQGTFFTDTKDLVGLMAKIDIEPRMPITDAMVVTSIEGSIASFEIPKGMVAISIPISQLSSVSYAPQRGDHVNILASVMFVDLDTEFQTILPNGVAPVAGPGSVETGSAAINGNVGKGTGATAGWTVQSSSITAQIGNGQGIYLGRAQLDPTLNQPVYVVPQEQAQRGRLVSQTLVQDAIVLRMGEFPMTAEAAAAENVLQTTTPQAPAQGTGQNQAASEAPTPTPAPKPNMITLVVTPQDAVTLNYLLSTGSVKITLVLRGAGDDQRVQTEAVTLQYLMDSYNIPLPAKLPYGMEPAPRIVNPAVEAPTATPVATGQ